MMRHFTWGLALALVGTASAQPLSEHVASYTIKARLDPTRKTLWGRQQLTWVNASPDPVPDLQFHLYMNAFKNEASTFMRESGGELRGYRARPGEWGWIEIEKLQILGRNPTDLTNGMEYLHPDDDNAEDRTVMKVPLPAPIAPGDSIRLEMDFTTKLPRVFARAGYGRDFYLVAQWFPKIGVWQQGKWNCHQYHARSEFFADFGVYTVEITVPSRFIVGATGVRQDSVPNADGTTTYTYHQADVHDFAWTADPRFRVFTDTFTHPDLPSVSLRLLLQPEHLGQAERYLRAVKNALKYFGQWYGPYPYPTLTVVDPPNDGRGAGGMEYPTLITVGTNWLAPKQALSPEGVTVHEFGHQYWYGMVANNEFEEAWLDEGFNTYSTGKVLEIAYGPNVPVMRIGGYPLLGFPFIQWNGIPLVAHWGPFPIPEPYGGKARYLEWSKSDPIVQESWKFLKQQSYGPIVYSKTELVLRTLEGYVGSNVMGEILRTYFQRWRFRHPTTRDFIETATEVAGRDLGWFFEQMLYGTKVLDYAVESISSKPVRPKRGVFGEGPQRITRTGAEKQQTPRYESEVFLQRLGEVIFPVTLVVRFDNGEVIREEWDGRDRWRRFTYVRPARVMSATVDPENKVVLDVNFANNSKTVRHQTAPILKWCNKWLFWMQALLHILSSVS